MIPLVPVKIEAGLKFQRRKPGQRPGQDEAEQRHERLVGAGADADQAQRHGRDQRDPAREAVEAVDEVDAVDHPHDPDDRGQADQDLGEAQWYPSVQNGRLTAVKVTPRAKATTARTTWPSNCQRARSWNMSSSRPMPDGQRAAAEEGDELRRDRRGRLVDEGVAHLRVDHEDEQRDADEADGDGHSAATGHRLGVDAARLGMVDHADPARDRAHDRGRQQRDERREQEPGDERRQRLDGLRREVHAAAAHPGEDRPWRDAEVAPAAPAP